MSDSKQTIPSTPVLPVEENLLACWDEDDTLFLKPAEQKELFPSKKKKRRKRGRRVRESQRKKRRVKKERILSEETGMQQVTRVLNPNQQSPTILSQLVKNDFDLKCDEVLDADTEVDQPVYANQEDNIRRVDRHLITTRLQKSLKEVLQLEEDGHLVYPLEIPKFDLHDDGKYTAPLFPELLRDTMKVLRSYFGYLDSEKLYNDFGIDLDLMTMLLVKLEKTRVVDEFIDYKCALGDIYRVRYES